MHAVIITGCGQRATCYFTAIVTLALLVAVPTVSFTGTELPVVIPEGTRRFTCITPCTAPGASPAYCTVAFTPPIVAVTGRIGLGSGSDVPLMIPSGPGVVIRPSPVAYSTTTCPAVVGFDALLALPF